MYSFINEPGSYPAGCSSYSCTDGVNTYCTPSSGSYTLPSYLGTPGPLPTSDVAACPAPGQYFCLDTITTCNSTTWTCNLCAAGYGSTGPVPWTSALCTACSSGYWNDGTVNGPCAPCTWCPTGEYVSVSPCSTSTSPCSNCATAPNCLGMSNCTNGSTSWCVTTDCAAGFYNAYGVCYACTPIPNCQYPSCDTASSTTCAQCSAGYWLSTDGSTCTQCNPSSSYCAAYTCTQTTPTTCTQCTNNIVVPLCAAYTCTATTATCSACKVGYYWNGTACTLCEQIEACLVGSLTCSTSYDSTCSLCLDGFYVYTQTGLCEPCTICQHGTYPSMACGVTPTTNTICTACTAIPNCWQSYCNAAQSTVCTLCIVGYYVTGSGTPNNPTTCAACSSPAITVANCWGYACTALGSSNTYCYECNNGLYLSTPTTCTTCAPVTHCQAGSVICSSATNSECTACVSGYAVNSQGGCSIMPPHLSPPCHFPCS